MKNIKIKSIKEGYNPLPKKQKSVFVKKNQIFQRRKWGCGMVILTILISIIFGAIGWLLADKFLSPYLEQIPQLKKYIKRSDNGNIVIRREENVEIPEDSVIIDIIKKISPSVVSIVPSENIKNILKDSNNQKVGTGFIITNDGLIITSKHIISNQYIPYTVITDKGEKFPAKIVSLDPITDLAILKIEANNLPVVTFGYSDQLQVGQKAIAIGNSFGKHQNTVSVGVISAIDKIITTKETSDSIGIIQTDIKINVENSGGPLVNISGEVIGINILVNHQNESIEFTVPIDYIRSAIDSVIKEGKIVRPFLGVRYISLTKEIAPIYNLPVENGALIYSFDNKYPAVDPEGPAELAGIKESDIITKVNNEEINQNNNLFILLQKYKPGNKIILTVLNDEGERNVEIILGKLE